MAKRISYQFLAAEVNRGTEENPNIEQILYDKAIICQTQAQYDANYPIAEREAIPGTIRITGEFDPEVATQEQRIAELEEALALLLSGVTE